MPVQKYDLKIQHTTGKLKCVADALSRHYLNETKEELIPEVDVNIITLNQHLPMSAERYKEFQQETLKDASLQQLLNTVLLSWPEQKQNIQLSSIPYWAFRDEISQVDGRLFIHLFKGSKLVIPKSIQQKILNIVHESHLGMVKCKSRARECMYWPYNICVEVKNSNPKEPMTWPELSDRPRSKIASDIFNTSRITIYFHLFTTLNGPRLLLLRDLASRQVINSLKSMYNKYGIPDELISDNGPQYGS